MTEVIVGADPELAAITELDAGLPGVGQSVVDVSGSVPNPVPSKFIRVVAAGGTQRDLVTDSPTLIVEAFAVRKVDAVRLALDAKAVLVAAGRAGVMGGVTCYRVRVISLPQNLPLPSLPGHHRYTFMVSADLRGTAV